MTSSFQPLMQLLPFDDIGLSHLQRLFDLHVSVRFCEPFPVYRGHLGCICISCTKILLYNFWLLFQAQHVCGIHHSIFCLVFMLACTLQFSSLFTGLPILCTLSQRAQVCLPHRLQHRYHFINQRLVAPVILVSSGSSPLAHQTTLHFSLSLPS